MITCLSDGSIQAFLDGELTVRETNSASSHFAECAACTQKMSAMKTRAHTVDLMLGMLGEESVGAVAPIAYAKHIPMVFAAQKRRYGFAASMTAVAALLLIVMLRMVNTPAPPPQQPSEKKHEVVGLVNAQVEEPAISPVQANPTPAIKAQAKKNTVPADDGGFISLNADDPIQIGKIVKMSLPASLFSPNDSMPSNERVMAEVLVGEDGRARAIRLLQSHQ